ncbi:Arylsulfatase [Pontiella desulfatans]|uniref:Arylsulfatase n=1 Tax=Pontiella desulfatans TaxID=2750659 RepID=A0A6C2U0C6_PONDE|nr:sulfatase [Pontiella desulfatans]SPS73783.1 sulfatase S1_7 [Kiritimatiellales bacterium]VGO13323.1 Arylsulfatase [Pontiella desulfatans]
MQKQTKQIVNNEGTKNTKVMQVCSFVFFVSLWLNPDALIAAEKPMNVVMIAIDDMNNWVGCLEGRAQTPNIDRLAKQGMLFSNAYCVVPACNPSRTAIMTGLRPETTGQFGNEGDFRLRPGGEQWVTIPQHFREHGYEAVAAGKIFHKERQSLEEPNPISDPVSWNDQWVGEHGTEGHENYLNAEGWAKWHNGRFGNYLGKFGVWGPCPEPKEETGDWNAAGYIADYVAQKHDKPFFAACGIFRPHEPLLAPQEYFDMFPLDEIELPNVPEDDFDDIPKIAHRNFSSNFFLKGVKEMGEWKKAVQAYLACMAFADDCVGRVIDAVENSPNADNTIIILWTDHGWQLGHKHRWEKFSLWRQGTNSPLIYKVPGLTKPGSRCERAATFLDIYPTLSELCGLPIRPELEGQSIVPLLKDPSRDWKVPAVITDHYGPDYSIVLDQWNYIVYRDGSEELYDHSKDPDEFTNLANNPEYTVVKKRLAKWVPTLKTNPKWFKHGPERARNKDMPH